jgi:hypothetical protein
MRKPLFLFVMLIPAALFAAAATVNVDYTTDVNSFSPAAAFSVNTGNWESYNLLKNNTWRFQHAGFRYIRFPGGSNSNEYHWNGDGYYDAAKIWHVTGSPNPTTFDRGFEDLSIYRGSTSAGYGKHAMVTDASLATSWKSFEGETVPQWIVLDFSSNKSFNKVVVEWGAPYAAQYKVQYSNAGWPGGLGIQAYNDTAWTDTSLGTIAGSGGQAVLNFSGVTAQYVRVLCLVPSSGTQYEIKDIKVFNGAAQVSVNSDDPHAQTTSVSSSVSLGDNRDYTGSMDFEQFMSICKSLTPVAEPLITVNFFTGTTQEAKDWVTYEKNKGYNIKYWEIGNENAGTWEAGGPVSPEFYAKRYLAFYDAMIAADNTITIMPQFNSITDPCNVTMNASGDYYIETFLKYLQAQGRLNIIKAISVHRYPTYEPASEAVCLAQTDIWNAEMTPLNSWINTYCGGPSNTKIWLTEYNDGIDSGFTNHYYNSLFISAYMLNYIKNGGDFGFLFTDFGTPGPGQFDLSIFSDLGAIEGGGLYWQNAGFRYQPRSSYWAMWMLNNRFSAADALGNTMVTASSSLPSLRVYANKRGDRKLSVILANTSNTTAVDAAISLTGFSPLNNADVMTFSPQQYSWIAAGTQSHADPDLAPVDSTIANASTSFTVNVPAYNIKIITMYDSAQAVFTPSDTPTQLPTPTISPTPLSNGWAIVDDCEDGDLLNFWNGNWSTYGDLISSYPLSINSMTCDGQGAFAGSNCYMKITGTVVDQSWGFGVNCPLNPSWGPTDVSMYDGVFLYYKGDGATARISFPQPDITNGNYGIDFNVNTYWAYYQIPFTSLTHATWNGIPMGTWTGTNIQDLQIQPAGGYSGPVYRELNIDNIGFYKNTPAASPTQSPVVSPTISATITQTRTVTATPTQVLAAPDLKHVKVFPQPCRMMNHECQGFTFKNLTSHVDLRVYNMRGELVFRVDKDTPAGEYFWNIGMRRTDAVAPGLYLYIIIDKNKEVARGRLTIIR